MQKRPVVAGDKVRFHDFAPLLLCTTDSVRELSRNMNLKTGGNAVHPISTFRPNIVLDLTNHQGPFAEETCKGSARECA